VDLRGRLTGTLRHCRAATNYRTRLLLRANSSIVELGVVLPRNRFDSKASPDSRRTSLMLHLPSDKSSRHHPPIFQRLFSKRLSSANAHLVKKIRVVMVNTYKHGWV